jgi:hypothetical protein
MRLEGLGKFGTIVKTLSYKPEGREFESRQGHSIVPNLHNATGRIR